MRTCFFKAGRIPNSDVFKRSLDKLCFVLGGRLGGYYANMRPATCSAEDNMEQLFKTQMLAYSIAHHRHSLANALVHVCDLDTQSQSRRGKYNLIKAAVNGIAYQII